jgi:hypothetical protein
MRLGNSLLVACDLAVALTFLSLLNSRAADVLDLTKAQQLLTDPDAVIAQIKSDGAEDVAWNWFIGLNAPLTDGAPKVWESWRRTSTVYLPNGQQPPAWGQTPAPPAAVTALALKAGLNTNLPFHNLDGDVQVDGLALRDAFSQNVRYELLMNQDTFTYIVSHGIYNVNGQQAMAQANTPANFPPTSFEIKTSWIWIGTNQQVFNQLKERYYIVNAYYALADGSGKPNGLYQVGRAALSGIHIISKPLPQWLWTTFQNVFDPHHTKAVNKLPISPAVAKANQKYRGALQKMGSIFANYQLIGTQSQFVNGAGKPVLLANSQIESAFQQASSCATCHSTASYSVSNGYFNLVKQQNGGITYYTGKQPTDAMQGYNPLDFVWSLKRAQWQR